MQVSSKDFRPLFYNFTGSKNYHLLSIFPREISCLFDNYGLSGTIQNLDARCRVTNQEYLELMHICNFFITASIGTLYIINVFYILLQLTSPIAFSNIHFQKTFDNLSFSKKLVILLLRINIDCETHNCLMSKLSPSDVSKNQSSNVQTVAVSILNV